MRMHPYTLTELSSLIIRLSLDTPLVLVIDDLQWLDKTSEEFIQYKIGIYPLSLEQRGDIPTGRGTHSPTHIGKSSLYGGVGVHAQV